MKFSHEDNGYCRVYYKGAVTNCLYCWMDGGYNGIPAWRFFICTSEGEPDYPVNLKHTKFPLCPGETDVGRDLNDYLKNNDMVEGQ